MELLRVENLSKTYGKGEAVVRALRDVSFSMERGEFAAVVGESGSGKSTLLNCIGGLDAPTGGKVYLDGEDLFSMTENKRTIAGSIGSAVFVGIMTMVAASSAETYGDNAMMHGMNMSFFWMAVGAAVLLLIAVFAVREKR